MRHALPTLIVWLLSKHLTLAVPVYMMLPPDTVTIDGNLSDAEALSAIFERLNMADVDGVKVEVWWGVVEREIPMAYNWNAYEQLIQMAQDANVKVQAVMAFHACGGAVGDPCNIPLPDWVTAIGKQSNNIFYTDFEGNSHRNYITLGADVVEVLSGRTPLGVYSDFMESFARTFADYMGQTLVEIQIGLGPDGELRYPAFPPSMWRYPGIGEFQCYDQFMLQQLKTDAINAGHPDWGHGPSDAGHYNDSPLKNPFFRDGGLYRSDYGRFFLSWYANQLVSHGDRVLTAAAKAFGKFGVQLSAKIAGVYWWYNTQSHAVELTAGYYNINGRDGYAPIMTMLARQHVKLDVTSLELPDDDNQEDQSRPEELIKFVFNGAIAAGIKHSGENSVAKLDHTAYAQILAAARFGNREIASFTYRTWSSAIEQPNNWQSFLSFVSAMHGLNPSPLLRQNLLKSTRRSR